MAFVTEDARSWDLWIAGLEGTQLCLNCLQEQIPVAGFVPLYLSQWRLNTVLDDWPTYHYRREMFPAAVPAKCYRALIGQMNDGKCAPNKANAIKLENEAAVIYEWWQKHF